METVSYTEARNHLKEIMDTVSGDHVAVRIQRRSGGNAVVLSEQDYQGLRETLYLLGSRANAQRLMEARETPAEQAIPWAEAKRRLGL